ncbi:hypothetical protein EON68_00125 [archaeon]|nr:MAG: hypothetical protein EON68_00125 [archaeon]
MCAPAYACERTCSKEHAFPSPSDAASVTLTVVVPAYNEAERLPPMMTDMIAQCERMAAADRYACLTCATLSCGGVMLARFTARNVCAQEQSPMLRVKPRTSSPPYLHPLRACLDARMQRVHVGDFDCQ